MRFTKAIPALLAAGCILAGQVNSANAYFTTYVTARGGYKVSWYHREEIKEEYEDWNKYVTISSKEGSIPVFVRASAFAGKNYELQYAGDKWIDGEDGYWYYDGALYEGKSTESLKVYINPQKIPQTPRVNDNFNVVVIYESVPATFDENGYPTNPKLADWNEPIGTGTDDYNGPLTPVVGN